MSINEFDIPEDKCTQTNLGTKAIIPTRQAMVGIDGLDLYLYQSLNPKSIQ
jgi:hypothetical protein